MSTLKVNTINAATTGQGVAVDVQNPRSFRNLIINGGMRVAQRGTSSTTSNSYTCDRFRVKWSGTDEDLTYSQNSSLGTTGPWEKGFVNSLKVQNGNQSGGAGAADYAIISYAVESHDIASCAWDWTSASSYITLSYWVKSSVAQTFYWIITSEEGTTYNYPISTGSLSANTWTKVTHSIPGNSNLTINNTTGTGLYFELVLFRGTDTTGSVTINQWATFASGARTPDNTSTWYTTNDATFEITGVQLEPGNVATDFEHRTYADEFKRCQRYFQEISNLIAYATGSSTCNAVCSLPTPMRATPTLTAKGTLNCQNNSTNTTQSSASTGSNASTSQSIYITGVPNFSGLTDKDPYTLSVPANNGNTIYCSAEL